MCTCACFEHAWPALPLCPCSQVEGLKLREAAASSPARQLSAGATHQLSLRSTPQALALLVRQHGWRCLYAGLHINYIKARALAPFPWLLS